MEVKGSKNSLGCLSYFRKRIRDRGIKSKILIEKFPTGDIRKWLISISPDWNVLCTCYNNNGEFSFEFSDGRRSIPTMTTLKTLSMNVVIEYLLKQFTILEKLKKEKDKNYAKSTSNTTESTIASSPAGTDSTGKAD